LDFSRLRKALAYSISWIDGCRLITSGEVHTNMQLQTLRVAGVSLSAAALALLAAEGPAAAHERTGAPDLRGRITSVTSADFVLQKYDGTTETVDTMSGTTYSEPGTSVAPAGVQDGENVAVTLDPSTSTPSATNVTVFPETVSGRVSRVSGSTVTLTTRRGTETVLVSPDTKYYEKGATPTDVSPGERVTAFGLPDPSTVGALDAQIVAIFNAPPQPEPQPQPQTDAVNPGPQVGPPAQPAPPQGATQGPGGWNGSAPHAPTAPHGSWGGPGPGGGPGSGSPSFGGHR
jgi:hypothetical protein